MNELLRRMLNLPPQASTVARDIDTLHYVIILTTLGGAGLVTLALAYLAVRYRRQVRRHVSPSYQTLADTQRKSRALEAGLVAALLAMFVGFWVVGFGQYVALRSVPADAEPVYVTAKKWMWTFAYPHGGKSHDELIVPAGQPIKLVMTSRDVVHAFYVPAFRIKQDIVPGRTTTAWFEALEPGRYPILCAEYCGVGHSDMLGVVVVTKPEDLASARPPPATTLAERGETLAVEHGCLRCHTVDGTPHLGPSWAGLFDDEIVLRDRTTLHVDEAYLTESMMDPAARVREGFSPLMPSYRGRLDAPEVAAIIEYIKALRDVDPRADSDPLPVEPYDLEVRP